MRIFAIADLHLSISVNKPMDIFGGVWKDYITKLKTAWEDLVHEEDTVIIPGDISWATYLDEAIKDFQFIESLPGKKVISKGNHDYWWTTMKKLEEYLVKNDLKTIKFVHNNSYNIGEVTICGARGWNSPGDEGFNDEDSKIYARELNRLELSLSSAAKIQKGKLVATMHYPPFNSKGQKTGFVDLMEKYNVDLCVYGHLHANGHKNAVNGKVGNTNYNLVASDYLNFMPLMIANEDKLMLDISAI